MIHDSSVGRSIIRSLKMWGLSQYPSSSAVRAMVTATPSSELKPRKNMRGTVSSAHTTMMRRMGFQRVVRPFQNATSRAGAGELRIMVAGEVMSARSKHFWR